MASLCNDPNGRRRILFKGLDGKRKTLRLGKVPKKNAESFQRKLESLISARIVGHSPDDEVSHWLAGLSDDMHTKLVKFNLTRPRVADETPVHPTVATFTRKYIDGKADIKPRTRYLLEETRRELLAYLAETEDDEMTLEDFTAGHAEDFRQWLLRRGLGENTVRRRCGRAKQFFRNARQFKLISDNPFDGMKITVGANESRRREITPEMAERVLDACPCPEWRLLFSLARYGGLRTPSEPLLLKWEHVNWEHNSILVHSPKTERHEGRGTRLIPIFAELRPHLNAVWDQLGPDGSEYVITRYRHQEVNVGTQLKRIIKRAGLEPWPRLWQNLRSTRETELAKIYPIQDVVAWMGNTKLVAMKHYLQQTQESFDRAVQSGAHSGADIARNAPHLVESTEQATSQNA